MKKRSQRALKAVHILTVL